MPISAADVKALREAGALGVSATLAARWIRFAVVEAAMVPHVRGRPLTLVRSPEGGLEAPLVVGVDRQPAPRPRGAPGLQLARGELGQQDLGPPLQPRHQPRCRAAGGDHLRAGDRREHDRLWHAPSGRLGPAL